MIANFYVHIIESPSPEELLNGLTEGRALCSFLDIARIPYSYNLAVNHDQFRIALTERVDEAILKFDLPPILHLSTHGGEHGIQLTSQRPTSQSEGELITWNELRTYIYPIHQSIGYLGICMSCCGGANGIKMAKVLHKKDVPFAWIIGTSIEIDLRDAALAFAVFYRRFRCGETNKDTLMDAMRFASGVYDFEISSGELIHQYYSQVLYENFIKTRRNR